MYKIYDEIVKVQRLVTENESKLTKRQLDDLRQYLNCARSIAGQAKV